MQTFLMKLRLMPLVAIASLVLGLTACSGTVNAEKKREQLAQFLAEPMTQEALEGQDGPYVFYSQQDQVDVYWYCDGELVHKRQSTQTEIPHLCGYKKPIQLFDAAEVHGEIQFQADRFAVISDIHGQFGVAIELLQKNGIIDDTWEWNYGTGHLIITGDVFDRGPQQTDALWFLYQLEQQALAAGGRVHLLLGNHETMIFYNDLRYLNKKYKDVAEAFDFDFPELYAEHSVLGQWLRTLPFIIRVNDMIFMHGGIHPEFLELGMTLEEVNTAFRDSLGMPRPEIKETPLLKWLYGSKGPIWYRGYFNDRHPLDEEGLQFILEELSLSHIIVGHTTFPGVFQHWDGRIYSVDSGMKMGKSGEILFYEDGQFTVGTYEGERITAPIWEDGEYEK